MACTIGRLSLVLASVAFSVVHSMVLPPGEYEISTRGSEQDHCQSCIELMTLLTNKSHEVNLEELEEKFGEIDDSGNLLCCVKTPSQILSLIRIVSYLYCIIIIYTAIQLNNEHSIITNILPGIAEYLTYQRTLSSATKIFLPEIH